MTLFVMAFYTASENMTNPRLGAYMRICDGFFWVWIFIGIGKPVLMSLDWFFGTKAFDVLDGYTQMAIFEIAEWFLTILILACYRGPLMSFYNTF